MRRSHIRKPGLLMTQPGVGAITALAFVLTIGEVARFGRGKQVASYLGLIPREHSSGGQQRLGSISKQGNPFLRMLLVESGADGGSPGRRISQAVSTSLSPQGQGSGQGGGGAEVSGATLLDAAQQHGVSGDRSYREQLAVPHGRRKLDREN